MPLLSSSLSREGHCTFRHQLDQQQGNSAQYQDANDRQAAAEEVQSKPDADVCWDFHCCRHEAADIAVGVKLGGVEGQAVVTGPDGEPARKNTKPGKCFF